MEAGVVVIHCIHEKRLLHPDLCAEYLLALCCRPRLVGPRVVGKDRGRGRMRALERRSGFQQSQPAEFRRQDIEIIVVLHGEGGHLHATTTASTDEQTKD